MAEEMNTNTQVTTVEEGVTAIGDPYTGRLEGDEVSSSVDPMPFLKLVSKNSQNVDLADGTRAENGTFYFTDLQKSVPELMIVILAAKEGIAQSGMGKGKPVINLIAITADAKAKPFMMSLQGSQMTAYGKWRAKMKDMGAQRLYDFVTKLSSREFVSDQWGPNFTTVFSVAKTMNEAQHEGVKKLFEKYKGALNVNDEEQSTASEQTVEDMDDSEVASMFAKEG